MATDPLFGWDLTFKTVEKDIKQKSDVIITFLHWNLTKRGFRNIGVGDEVQRTFSGDESKTELLPSGWNESEKYTLRYILDAKLYILHGVISDGTLIVNLMRSEDLAVSNIAVNIEDTVSATSGSIEKMLPNYKEFMYQVKRDLIDSVADKPTSSAETQTLHRPNTNESDEGLRISRPRPEVVPESRNLWEQPPPNLRNLGRSDLDPFAPPGGGMLFNPFQPGRDIENPGLGIPGGLPRGAVPPGARFDPFGPPGVGPLPGRRPPPPDADHFPPPGFNDNMFL